MAATTFAAQNANAHPDVQVQKEAATIEEKVFDPDHLPDPPPPVPYGLKAVTHYDFYCYADARCDWLDDGMMSSGTIKTRVRLRSLRIKLRLPLTVWLPQGHTEHLRQHELGHTRIDKHIYESAELAAEEVGAAMIGQEFIGTGRDLDEARSNGINAAIEEFSKRYHYQTKGIADRLNDRYDRLTNHGRNDVPVEKAIEQTYSEARSASLRGPGGRVI